MVVKGDLRPIKRDRQRQFLSIEANVEGITRRLRNTKLPAIRRRNLEAELQRQSFAACRLAPTSRSDDEGPSYSSVLDVHAAAEAFYLRNG